jgi:hypothetical protein
MGCAQGVLRSTAVGNRPISVGAVMLLVGAASTARADCKPTAVPDGDPALVRSLIARLTANGIATTPAAGCPTVAVHLQPRGLGLHMTLADAYQRKGERDVQDVATAAVIVESWTHQEIDEGSLPPEAEPAVTAAVVVAEPSHLVRSGIGASVTSAVGSNGGTVWVGGVISACLRVGPFCAGASVGAELDTRATGDTRTIDQDSYLLSPMATIDLPRKLGSFVVIPGVGAGYGDLHVTTHHHDAMNNPLDAVTSDHQLRTGAHVALSRPLGNHLSVFGDLWADAAILRSDTQFGPSSSLRLSVGIRLEAP